MSTLMRFLEQEGAVTSIETDQLTVSALRRKEGLLTFDENDSVASEIIQDLCGVAGNGFGAPPEEHQGEGARSHIQGVDALLLLHNKTQALGFASAFFPREGFLYLHGIVLSPAAKGKGGSRLLVRSLLEMYEGPDIALSTQNPVVFCLLRSMYRAVYPSPEAEMPQRLWDRAQGIVRERSGTFDVKTGVRLKAYTQCLYPQIPESGDQSVNDWFARQLQIEDGKTRNGFLFLGEGYLP